MHLKSVIIHPEKFPTTEVHPFNLRIFQQTESFNFKTPVTFFIGENGTGKSTLLEAISRQCDIHIWQETERLRFENNPYEGTLHTCLSIEWITDKVPGSFFGSDIFYFFTQILDEWAASDPGQLKYFGGRSLVSLSHGQSLMAFFRARYQIKGLYLLDEPETALSPRSQLELLDLIVKMSRAGHAQFIIATHSPILLACPGATIYSFNHTPIKQVQYEETEYFQLYHSFMVDRNKYLKSM
jgi:predicted ATPase